jgi:NifU-like protein
MISSMRPFGGAGQACACERLDEAALARLIRDNRLNALGDLRAAAGFRACARCEPVLGALLERANAALVAEGVLLPEEAFSAAASPAPAPAPAPRRALPVLRPAAAARAPGAAMRREEVEAALGELRPRLEADGGGCELLGVEGDRVGGCHLASSTTAGLQEKLAERLGRLVRVVPVRGDEAA